MVVFVHHEANICLANIVYLRPTGIVFCGTKRSRPPTSRDGLPSVPSRLSMHLGLDLQHGLIRLLALVLDVSSETRK